MHDIQGITQPDFNLLVACVSPWARDDLHELKCQVDCRMIRQEIYLSNYF